MRGKRTHHYLDGLFPSHVLVNQLSLTRLYPSGFSYTTLGSPDEHSFLYTRTRVSTRVCVFGIVSSYITVRHHMSCVCHQLRRTHSILWFIPSTSSFELRTFKPSTTYLVKDILSCKKCFWAS